MNAQAQTTVNELKTLVPADDKKRNALYECETLEDKDGNPVGVSWKFRGNGPAVQVALKDLPPALLSMAACHGIKQKCNDAMAIAKDTSNGKSASDADKIGAFLDVFTRITKQHAWNGEREANGNTLLFRALAKVKSNVPEAELRKWFDAQTDDVKKALRKNAAVAKAIIELQSAGATDEAKKAADAALKELDKLGK